MRNVKAEKFNRESYNLERQKINELQAKADAIYDKIYAGISTTQDHADLRALEWRIEAIYERIESKKKNNYDFNIQIIK